MRRWLPVLVLALVVPASCTSKQEAFDVAVADAPAAAVEADTLSQSGGIEIGPEVPCVRGGTPGVFTESREALGISFVQANTLPPGGAAVGGGLAVADFDMDGALDVYFTNTSGSDEVYLTGGKGPLQFHAESYPNSPALIHIGAYVADADGDGDPDLLFSPPESGLGINDGTGHFTQASAGIKFIHIGAFEPSASWLDLNLDGHLDICVAGGADHTSDDAIAGLSDRCFVGDGKLGFTEVPIPKTEKEGQAFIVGVADVDNDADPDLYIVNDFGMMLQPNELFLNDGKGTFTAVSFDSDSDVGVYGMGLALGDIDNDGWLDLYTCSMRPVNDVLVRNRGDGTFEDVTMALNAGSMEVHEGVSWGAQFIDVENDGDEDLFVAHGQHQQLQTSGQGLTPNPALQPDVLLINQGGQGFVDGTVPAGVIGEGIGRSPVEADLDRDGFPDLVVGNLNGPPYVYLNGCSTDVGWLGVRFKPTRANPSAIGTRVDAVVAGVHHIREIGSGADGLFGSGPPEVTIGLGAASKVDTLRVVWPGGEAQEFHDVPVRRWVTVTQ